MENPLLSRRERMEREIDELLLEVTRLRREIETVEPPPAVRVGASAEEVRARLRSEAEYRRRVDRLVSRKGELRSRINRIKAQFAELTSRIATAHGGELPDWWPAELRCGRCSRASREDSTTP